MYCIYLRKENCPGPPDQYFKGNVGEILKNRLKGLIYNFQTLNSGSFEIPYKLLGSLDTLNNISTDYIRQGGTVHQMINLLLVR